MPNLQSDPTIGSDGASLFVVKKQTLIEVAKTLAIRDAAFYASKGGNPALFQTPATPGNPTGMPTGSWLMGGSSQETMQNDDARIAASNMLDDLPGLTAEMQSLGMYFQGNVNDLVWSPSDDYAVISNGLINGDSLEECQFQLWNMGYAKPAQRA